MLVNTVDAEFVMQVWTGGEAGHADTSDHLTLANMSADPQAFAEAREMAIERRILGAVLEDNDIAIALLPADELDDDVACSLDRCAYRRSEERRVGKE